MIKELLKKTIKNSYSPYSNFKVAAAVETEDDKIFTGVNVENSSFSLTICAERVAMFKAISEGYRKFKKLYIYTETEIPVPPCGACLQVLSEFCEDVPVVVMWKNGERKNKLSELLRWRFKL